MITLISYTIEILFPYKISCLSLYASLCVALYLCLSFMLISFVTHNDLSGGGGGGGDGGGGGGGGAAAAAAATHDFNQDSLSDYRFGLLVSAMDVDLKIIKLEDMDKGCKISSSRCDKALAVRKS